MSVTENGTSQWEVSVLGLGGLCKDTGVVRERVSEVDKRFWTTRLDSTWVSCP